MLPLAPLATICIIILRLLEIFVRSILQWIAIGIDVDGLAHLINLIFFQFIS